MKDSVRFAKQLLDRAGATVLLVLTCPLFLLAMAVIKVFSKGPCLFVQERVGLNERPFWIYKFRTMHVEPAGSASCDSVTVLDDPRLFRGARLLRKWKIDELPQLLNVMNGTMSLVGPRPTVREDHDRMTVRQRRRVTVKPGITGLAQICGGTSLLWPQRIEYDLQYIDQKSIWLDLTVLFRTLVLVVTGRADTHPPGNDEWGASAPILESETLRFTNSQRISYPIAAVRNDKASPTACFPSWPHFDDEQIEAVTAVLRSGNVNYWTGNEGRLFEREFRAAVGTKHAVAVANGTLALELALYGLEIGPGDEVVVPCRTFLATASAVVMRGAIPVFADVDRTTGNITAETIESACTARTKAILVVHLSGWPCDMDPIMELARDRGLYVIEDCAQAHGATYKGRPVGSIGDVGAFSFCQDKIITTGGEGGMLTTNNQRLWDRAWSYKDHGKSWNAVYNRRHTTIFKWVHESLGTNWRMTEMQAAIGRVALRRLAGWVEKRRHHAEIFNRSFENIPALRTTVASDEYQHSYYKYYVYLRPGSLRGGWSRDRIVNSLQAAGIACGTGTCPEIYLEKAFQQSGYAPTDRLPVAQELGETSLMFPVHPQLADNDVRQMCRVTQQILSAATTSQPSSERRAA